jgi:ankyrin repeat protein
LALHLQEALKLLLAHGCNIKASAMDDMNALHFAAQKGQLEAIRRLITAGEAAGSVMLFWLII